MRKTDTPRTKVAPIHSSFKGGHGAPSGQPLAPRPSPGSEALRRLRPAHLDMLRALVAAQDGQLTTADLLATMALNRSLSLMDGFLQLTAANNAICAVPLLRLQLDSVLRLYAHSVAADPSALLERVLSGAPLTRKPTLTSVHGERLTDTHLIQLLMRDSDLHWFQDVYEATSGYVHMSRAHFLGMLVDDQTSGSADRSTFSVGRGIRWRPEHKEEAIEAFTAATEALLRVCAGFLQQKQAAG